MLHNGLRDNTLVNHYITLMKFGEWCKIPFTDLCSEDIYDYFEFLEKCTYMVKGKQVKYNPSTVYYYKSFLNKFLMDIIPEEARIIKIKKTKAKTLPEDTLTEEEVEKLISVASNNRDRALIAMLYESGARKGELLSVRLKNVQFDKYGAVVILPDGKTGPRRIRVVFSASYLRDWISVHPMKDDREAPLFCSFRKPYPVISNSGLANQINELTARAGVQKHLFPHAFRHSRATHLAAVWPEQLLKEYLGWTKDSTMASIYVHLSGKDCDNAVLKMNGIEIEEVHPLGLKVGRCPRCKELNPETSLYCGKCGMPLTYEVEDMENKLRNNLLTSMSPEHRDKFNDLVEEKAKEK